MTERLAYDPWGKRRFISSTPGLTDSLDAITGIKTDRGYTEHEHLDEVGVIHMNGRVYDPLMGRFMSADPHVTYPLNLQSFNRYAYVLNNPFKYKDPSGFDAWSHEDSDGGSTYNPSTNGGGLGGISPGNSLSGGGSNSTGNAGNAFVCNCWFAVPSLQSILTGVPDAVLGIGGAGMWRVSESVGLSDLHAARDSFDSVYAVPNQRLELGLQMVESNIIARSMMLASASIPLGGGTSGAFAQSAGALRGGILGLVLSLTNDSGQQYIYVTYTRMHPLTRQVYSGRSGGYGDPDTLVRQRGLQQAHLNAEGFGPPQLDQWSTDNGAIRGREQMLIDYYGGAQSVGGTARNKINGVSDLNPNRPYYFYRAGIEFGILPDNSPDRPRLLF